MLCKQEQSEVWWEGLSFCLPVCLSWLVGCRMHNFLQSFSWFSRHKWAWKWRNTFLGSIKVDCKDDEKQVAGISHTISVVVSLYPNEAKTFSKFRIKKEKSVLMLLCFCSLEVCLPPRIIKKFTCSQQLVGYKQIIHSIFLLFLQLSLIFHWLIMHLLQRMSKYFVSIHIWGFVEFLEQLWNSEKNFGISQK